MVLNSAKQNSFEDNIYTKPNCITKVNEVLTCIMNTIPEGITERTAINHLNTFKKIAFYCSSDLCNPMFLSMAHDTLHLSDEVLYIHERMLAFLHHNNFLQFDALEKWNDEYNPESFSWNVPEIFMPIATAYIVATVASKKCCSTRDFFSTLDDYFHSFPNTPDITKETYKDWTNLYLGREYFCNLEDIYKTYAKTPEQLKLLRSSLYSLTRLFVECPLRPNPVPSQICSLLKHYKLKLEKFTSLNTDLTLLYPYDTPWKPAIETQLSEFLISKILPLTGNLFNFLETSLDRSSTYKISVIDFNLFNETIENHMDDICSQFQELSKEIDAAYHSLLNTPSVINAIEQRYLKLTATNLNKHKEKLNSIISEYEGRFMSSLYSFIKKVNWASGEQPEKYLSLRINVDYFTEFKNKVTDMQNSLKKELLNFNNTLDPFFSLHKAGYIQELEYPVYSFSEDDILKITHELTHDYCILSKEHLINHFKSKGLRFPITRPDVIIFLLNLDQIVEGL